jgi:hypothetical protein
LAVRGDPIVVIQIKAHRLLEVQIGDEGFLEERLVWSSTRILWDQQVLLLWILLPPIFVACGFLALAAPYLVRKKDEDTAQPERFVPDRTAVADRRS